jgi:hypothetical protein
MYTHSYSLDMKITFASVLYVWFFYTCIGTSEHTSKDHVANPCNRCSYSTLITLQHHCTALFHLYMYTPCYCECTVHYWNIYCSEYSLFLCIIYTFVHIYAGILADIMFSFCTNVNYIGWTQPPYALLKI